MELTVLTNRIRIGQRAISWTDCRNTLMLPVRLWSSHYRHNPGTGRCGSPKTRDLRSSKGLRIHCGHNSGITRTGINIKA